MTSFRFLLPLTAAVLLVAQPAMRADDKTKKAFGTIGAFVAQLLQSSHYSRQPFDDEMSKMVLDEYLSFLDYNHYYFLQSDIDRFRTKYATRLDNILLSDKSLEPAYEIYDLYFQRVTERVNKIKADLAANDFDFDADKTILLSREHADWPADAAAADRIWKDLLTGELIKDKLSKEIKAAKAAEKEAAKNTGENPPEPEIESDEPDTGDDTPKTKTDEEEEKPIEEQLNNRFSQFLRSLEQNDEEEVANFFLSTLSTVYDPHCEYFSHSEWSAFETGMNHKLIGVGALLRTDEGMAKIEGIVLKGPADMAGNLHIGDRIIAVGQGEEGDWVDIQFMKLSKVVELIRGKEDTVVRLRKIPAGADDPSLTEDIKIVRKEVKLKDKLATSLLIEMKKDEKTQRIGWITLPSFYGNLQTGETSVTHHVNRFLTRLMEENIDGLIIDLRGNGGGLLDEVVKMTGLFVPRGPIVQSRDYRNNLDVKKSTNPNPVYDGPMVLLTDRTSASASEIMAAALQDYGRAVVVGEKSTFGKGTVQTLVTVAKHIPFFARKFLPDGGSRAGRLKVTVQKYYRILGGSTQLKGVVPDVIIPSVRDAMEIGEEALDHHLEYDTIRPLKFKTFTGEHMPIGTLQKNSAVRLAQDKDFSYILEDIDRRRELTEKNVISLNLEERKEETRNNRERYKTRNKERRERFAAIEKKEKDMFKVYKLTLDNLNDEILHAESEFTDEDNTGMRTAKNDKEDDIDKAPEYPHGFDPTKREVLNVMDDLIEAWNSKTEPVTASQNK